MNEFAKTLIDFIKTWPSKILEAFEFEIGIGLTTEIWNIIIKILPLILAFIAYKLIRYLIKKYLKKQKEIK